MNLAVKNSAYKSYLEQAKEAFSNRDFQRSKDLYLKAATITNEIAVQSDSKDIQKEYYTITRKIIDVVKNMQSDRKTVKETNKKIETETPIKISLDEALANLNSLIGLENVKRSINNWVNQIKVFQKREESGLKVPPMSYHMVFSGNPGTGKTTVARIISQIYHALGIVSKGHLVEVGREDLVAGYVGQTAILTKEKIVEALDGVLFIDEAYRLLGEGNDFGKEAIDTLVQSMGNHRNSLVVIVAGYEKDMEKFIKSNPGLQSRFKNFIKFEDYNPTELLNIFRKFCADFDYKLDIELVRFLSAYFNNLYANRDENFGNGRDVRNFFEDMITKQSNRVVKIEDLTKDQLMTFTIDDVPE
jgi:SpoVK/Ycf46/Vps4 family AAA+-type ATPase